MDGNANQFDLGTEFELHLGALADNEASYTVAQLVTALETTTTLTKLTVYGGSGVCEPLCQCLANLRLQNEDHPLKEVELRYMYSDIIRQFLVATKHFGISHVTLRWRREFLPVHFLKEFCCDNNNLKVLELDIMIFTDEGVADLIGGSADTTLKLDKLVLNHVGFKASTAATKFADFVAHLSVSALVLGGLQDEENDEFKMPSVEQITLCPTCKIKHFRAALDAGMSTITRLTVDFDFEPCEVDVATEKVESLTHMIQGAVKLNSLSIQTYGCDLRSLPLRQLFQAVEACASVTEIRVNEDDGDPHDFTDSEVRQLHRIATRNRELEQFVANPSTFPNAKLVTLMRQFNNCPTGLYLLTRRLPEAFSFQKGSSLFPLISYKY